MNYLVGENIFSLNSGTEFSQMQRYKAFKAAGIPTKIVVRNYNRFLGQTLEANHIDPHDVINMYDFFQGTTDVPRKKQSLRLLKSIPLADYHINGIDNNHSLIQDEGKTIAIVHVMPATVGLVGDIQYLDDLGHEAVGEFWDWRGFKSMVEHYHPDGSVATQRYLRQDGSTAIEVVHMHINHQLQPTMWRLCNYHGYDYVFDTENQLFSFFLNELNAKGRGTFISDRRSVDGSVLSIVNPVQTVAAIHSLTFNNYKYPKKAGILPAYRTTLNQEKQRFNKVVFPTEDQLKDTAAVVGDSSNFFQAADCAAAEVGNTRQLEQGPRIVFRGMLGSNRNLADLINAFRHIYKRFPQAKLLIQGYFTDQKYKTQLQDQVEKYRLKDKVEFLNYSVDDKVYNDATVFLSASDNEAFGITMLESMAHGVPVIAYDTLYSSGNLIKDGVNGCLVKNRTPNQLAKQVVKVLSDGELYQKLSAGAVATAKRFSPDHLVQQWQRVLTENN